MGPSLTVRAFAEMLELPLYEQVRILNEQKYPKDEPQKFRLPFYDPALRAIRRFYSSGRDPAVLKAARVAIDQGIGLEARRKHNHRVIDGFERSPQAKRDLDPIPSPKWAMQLAGSLELRLKFDVVANEGKADRFILYNLRAAPLDAAMGRKTLELAHWVLESEGHSLAPIQLEFVDLYSGTVIRGRRRTASSEKLVKNNARVIANLWPTL